MKRLLVGLVLALAAATAGAENRSFLQWAAGQRAPSGWEAGNVILGYYVGASAPSGACEVEGQIYVITTTGGRYLCIAGMWSAMPHTHTVPEITGVTASKLVGRGSAGGTGVAQEIVLGTNLSMSGTTLNASGGGSAAWGAITGTLSDQSDLQSALNAKEPSGAFSGIGACASNSWASTLNDTAAPTCTQPAFSNISGAATDAQIPNTIALDNLTQIVTREIADTNGILAVPRGGNGAAPGADDQILVSDSTSAATWRVISDCQGAGKAVTYTASTNTFGCNTISGGGGSGNFVAVDVDFAGGNTNASTVVTGQAWVTSASIIQCSPSMIATSSRAEGSEDAVLEGLAAAVHSRSAGVGFTLSAAPRLGSALGVYTFFCSGG